MATFVLLIAQPVGKRLVDIWDLTLGLLDWRVAAVLWIEPLVLSAQNFRYRTGDD